MRKLFVILIVCLTLCYDVHAQEWILVFKIRFDGSNFYESWDVGTDENGSIYYYISDYIFYEKTIDPFTKKVNSFDYVYTYGNGYFTFKKNTSSFDDFDTADSFLEVSLGKEISNSDENNSIIKSWDFEDNSFIVETLVSSGDIKFHRIYERDNIRAALIWDKEGMRVILRDNRY